MLPLPARATVVTAVLLASVATSVGAASAGAARAGTASAGAGTPALARTARAETATVPRLSVCLKLARAVIAHRLHVSVDAVRMTQRVGTNGMPQCNFLVHRVRVIHPLTRAVVVVNVDNGPQAAWRLMRKIVEAEQLFGAPPPGWKPPLGLLGLGPFAGWYPNLDQLMANNVTRRYLLTVSVLWYRSRAGEMLSLARAVVLPYRRVRRFPRYSGPLRVGARH